MNISESLYRKHQDCDVYVDRQYMPRKLGGVTRKQDPAKYMTHAMATHWGPALMCRNHGCWIKWLSSEEAMEIERITHGL